MNYLLDTHIFLWAIFEPEKITKKLRNLILDPESVPYVSIISFWEISLKFSKGKIDLKGVLPDDLPTTAKKDGFKIMQLDENITSSFYKLPRIKNQDPFDRMIAWQAICHNHILLTQDKGFVDYENHGLKIYQ